MATKPSQYRITVKIEVEERYGDYSYTRSFGGTNREVTGLDFTSIKNKLTETAAEAIAEVREIIQPKLDSLKELAVKEASESSST